MLKAYAWPGNIRQLENVIERAVVIAEGPVVTVDDLPAEILTAGRPGRGEEDEGADDSWPAPLAGPFPADEGSSPSTGSARARAPRARMPGARPGGGGRQQGRGGPRLGVARSTLVSRLKKLGLG